MNKTKLGEIAYEAYWASKDHTNRLGHRVPPFSRVPRERQTPWIALGQAVAKTLKEQPAAVPKPALPTVSELMAIAQIPAPCNLVQDWRQVQAAAADALLERLLTEI